MRRTDKKHTNYNGQLLYLVLDLIDSGVVPQNMPWSTVLSLICNIIYNTEITMDSYCISLRLDS